MSKTKIGYVDYSCNPYLWRCQKRSPGCANCYANALATRYGQDFGGCVGTRFPAAEAELDKMPPGKTVFLNDMSDTYYEHASDADVMRVHEMPVNWPHLYFLIVTKRPERAYFMRHRLSWPENLWLTVSVESNKYLWRINYALATPAAHVAVSAEPLLGSLDGLESYLGKSASRPWRHHAYLPAFYEEGRRVEWVIAGGESGDNRRPLRLSWVRRLRLACQRQGVDFFYKQGSAKYPGQDRLLDGETWDEIPAAFGGSGATGPTATTWAEPVTAGGVTQLALF